MSVVADTRSTYLTLFFLKRLSDVFEESDSRISVKRELDTTFSLMKLTVLPSPALPEE
jgi:hypothetical protein